MSATELESFNLVIENLLISTKVPTTRGCVIPISFNLVIENLLISTHQTLRLNLIYHYQFQSRNRESSYFNQDTSTGWQDYCRFQSRNRESSYFNARVTEAPRSQTQFQSRNRESSYFNNAAGQTSEVTRTEFQSRNRESSYFN